MWYGLLRNKHCQYCESNMDLEYIIKNGENSTQITEGNSYDEAVKIVYIILLSAAMILGTFGNLLVVAAVVVYKPLRTTGNMFVVNLAIADLCVTAFVDPFSILGAIKGEEFFINTPFMCDAVAAFCLVSCTCSLMTIAAIAINRYIVICKNMLYKDVYTYKRTFIYCIILWIISIGLDLPNFVDWGDHWYDNKMMICTFNRMGPLSYTVFLFAVAVFTPLILICFCYLKILIFVKRSNKTLVRIAGRSAKSFSNVCSKRRKEDLQLTKTLFIIFCVFVICWAPYVFVILVDRTDSWSKLFYIIIIQFAHTNSSVNSMLYAATNRKFRRGYKAACLRIFCGRKPFEEYALTNNSFVESKQQSQSTTTLNLLPLTVHNGKVNYRKNDFM